ncbi:amidohydrolase [Aureibacillus halotolerans]|uniref:Amidohydrolase n=1 Tax=Aureibacillus halotolerans TaxID=1508390 RepID=A0A4R6UB96_9BACI|nr:amidohydrolase [Aureibacillus halotolerans]TDQ42005.1 amidohydrolase [Aureibacillus halotolerans]
MKTALYQTLDNKLPSMVKVRRHLHMHPELSFHETKTAAFIAQWYETLGIPYRANVGGNGIVATIKGELPGKTVALRADFDALPIQDEKKAPYSSVTDGVCHACGHDGHTSTLLHVAESFWLHKAQLQGTIVLIHQHAEELHPGGAQSMIDDGCLEGVDMIFGTHLWSLTPTGTVQYVSGPMMAAADKLDIVVQGKGGHGAQPHHAKDAIVAASQLVLQLQTVVSRNIDPLEAAVLSIGSFEARNPFNVIADRVTMSGTVRTFQPTVRNAVEEATKRICDGVARSANVHIDLTYLRSYPAVVNHDVATTYVKKAAEKVPEVTHTEQMVPVMPAEDFAYYLEHVEGAFFFTGAQPDNVDEPFPHHHPRFDFNEKALLIAAKTLTGAALDYLSTHAVK